MVDLEYEYDPDEEPERRVDPSGTDAAYHDTLISNPEYREAYNEAVEDGLESLDAHKVAHVLTYDKQHALSKFDADELEEALAQIEGSD